MRATDMTLVASAQAIHENVARLAEQISRDYQDKELLTLGVLKGAFIFMADLVRKLTLPVEVEFVRAASYGHRLRSSGKVRLLTSPRLSLKGRHVLLVEDIVDEGHTIRFLRSYCEEKGAASVRLCTMFMKGKPKDYPFPIEYVGVQIPKLFVVGYGLDAQEQYRNLPDLRALAPAQEKAAV